MNKTITDSAQDYLKAIYDLTRSGQPASTNALAARLSVAPASVTGMIQKLSTTRPALLSYRKHQGVKLSPSGERAALEVIRHHRLLETYLVSALGYSWDEVHQEAERLEHVISEDFEARIADALGNPERDPHGEPIPSADLEMPELDDLPLSQVAPGQTVIVRRVIADDPDLLRYFEALGILPGVKLRVLSMTPFDGNLRVRLKSKQVILGLPLSSRVFVELPVSRRRKGRRAGRAGAQPKS